MSEYIIKKISKDGYDRFLLLLTCESIFDYIKNIEETLTILNTSGRVLIDQLFLTGNCDNRFISCEFKDGKLDFKTAHFVNPSYYFRKETVNWLHNHYNYVENSILTETQREKIMNEIVF